MRFVADRGQIEDGVHIRSATLNFALRERWFVSISESVGVKGRREIIFNVAR